MIDDLKNWRMEKPVARLPDWIYRGGAEAAEGRGAGRGGKAGRLSSGSAFATL